MYQVHLYLDLVPSNQLPDLSHVFQDMPRLFAKQHHKESSDPDDPKELQILFFYSLKQKAVLHNHRKLPILGLVLLYEGLSISSLLTVSC